VRQKKLSRAVQQKPKPRITLPRWAGVGDKTIWDWVNLLVLPIILTIGGYWFTAQQDTRQQQIENQRARVEREIEEQRAQDAAVQAYLDQMNALLLENKLRDSDERSEVRTLARARTITVLGRLDPSHGVRILQFLVEAELVQRIDGKDPVISLEGADLRGIAFPPETELSGADLRGADLRNADLTGAIMADTILSDADLSDATLSNAYLSNADLSEADLSNADLSNAYLSDATLSGADLSDAYLSEADLSNADLSNAYLTGTDLSDTIMTSANLSDADLSDAYLSDADLSNAYLTGADLSDATGITAEELERQARLLQGATRPNGLMFQAGNPEGKQVFYEFDPAFSLDVGEGWNPEPLEKTDVVELKEVVFGSEPGGVILVTNPRQVYDPSTPGEPKEIPAPENVAEWISWFERHPHLETTKPNPVRVGGASGKRIEVRASSKLENYSRNFCDSPCVPLYPTSEFPIVGVPEARDRFVIVDVGSETVVIDVYAPADRFDAFLRKAQEALDSVEWKGT
jgi:uncharacterized protein YjbI with pentapeptide repeats